MDGSGLTESGRAEAWVGVPEKASETPQGMKRVDPLVWSGLGGETGRLSGNGIGPTLGVGGQRELLNSETPRGSKEEVVSGQRTASW